MNRYYGILRGKWHLMTVKLSQLWTQPGPLIKTIPSS